MRRMLTLVCAWVLMAATTHAQTLTPSQILRPEDHAGMPEQPWPFFNISAVSSGDWLAVGMPYLVRVEGNADQSGRVLLWKRVAGLWQPRQVLRFPHPLPQPGGLFGRRVLIDGPNMLVGDNRAMVHAYRLERDQWVYIGRLVPPGEVLMFPDGTGTTLSFDLDGDTAVVSSVELWGGGARIQGQVDVFQRRGTGWAHVTRLKETGVLGKAFPSPEFGADAMIAGDSIYVGDSSFSGYGSPYRVAVFKRTGSTWVKSRDLRMQEPWLAGSFGLHLWKTTADHFYEYSPLRGYELVSSGQDRGALVDMRGNTAVWTGPRSGDRESVDFYERMPDQRWRLKEALGTAEHGLVDLHLVHLADRELMVGGGRPGWPRQFEIRVFPRPQQSNFEFDHVGTVPVPLPAEDAAATVTRLDAGELLLGREAKPLVTLMASHAGTAAAELGVAVTGDTGDFSLSATKLLMAARQNGAVKVSFKPLTAGEKHLFVNFTPKGESTPVQRYEIVVRAVTRDQAEELVFTRQPLSGLYGRGEFEGLHAEVKGAAPITYRWLKDGKPVPGATSTSLWPKEGGRYQLEATNPRGTVQSEVAVLGFYSIEELEVITTPGAVARCAITLSGPADLLAVQWRDGDWQPLENGADFEGVTGPVLTVKNPPALGEGVIYNPRVSLNVGAEVKEATHPISVITRRPPVLLGLGATEIRVGEVADLIPEVDYPGWWTADCTFSGLPPGLQGYWAGMYGAPTKAGVYTVKLTYRVDIYTVTKSFLLTVLPNGPPPGIYWGEVARTEAFPELGEMMLDVNSAGSYTGSLGVGSTRLPLKGGLANLAQWKSPEQPFPVKVGGKSYVFWLQTPYYMDLEHPVYELFIRRADFSLTSEQVLQLGTVRLLKAHSAAQESHIIGGYNFGLFSPGPAPVGTLEVPQGHGFGTLKVAANGRVTYTALMPDGSSLTGATWMSAEDLRMPIHQWATATRTLLHGSPRLGQPNMRMTWERPAQKGRLYPGGISPQEMEFYASRYVPVNAQPLLEGLAHELGFSAYLTSPAPVEVTLTPQHGVVFGTGAANPLKAALKIAKATGLFTGQFTLTDPDPANTTRTITRTVKHRGILLQGLERGVGHFQVPMLPDANAQPPTKITTSPMVSGAVMLRPTMINP